MQRQLYVVSRADGVDQAGCPLGLTRLGSLGPDQVGASCYKFVQSAVVRMFYTVLQAEEPRASNDPAHLTLLAYVYCC